MANLNDLISEAKLTHREVSIRTGNGESWFNDAYNNNEDITISSFTKILSVIMQKVNIEKIDLITIFDHKILAIASVISKIADESSNYLGESILAERHIFVELLGDWASMAYRNKLNDIEEHTVNQVRHLISNN